MRVSRTDAPRGVHRAGASLFSEDGDDSAESTAPPANPQLPLGETFERSRLTLPLSFASVQGNAKEIALQIRLGEDVRRGVGPGETEPF